jgi:hypothetical protein
MSLLVVSARLPGGPAPDPHLESQALAQAQRQGFEAPQVFKWAQGTLWWFATPNNVRGSGAFVQEANTCIASVGTFHWHGLAGEAALRALLQRRQRPQDLPLDELSGSFAMFLANDTGVWLFGDALGLHKIHETAGGALRSTSMLVCRATLRRPTVNRLRAQEYVLLGANHALQSPLQGLGLLDPTTAADLVSGVPVPLYAAQRLRQRRVVAGPAQAVEAAAHSIAQEFAHIGRAFGPNIGMALSGGFDSRLLLAALDHAGVKPHLFVYGSPGDPDVDVASAVAARLAMPIYCANKGAADRELPRLTTGKLQANLQFFDGLPVDGVFDRGTDQSTRLQQMENGRLNLNGGGGEVLRNFFYLRDGRYTAADLVAAFYGGWLAEVFPTPPERQAFVLELQDRILDSLGLAWGTPQARAQQLVRSDVELVYTLFRLRYWMGRNNSVSSGYGAFMTPLVTPGLVTLTAALPMAWKHYGQLEAQVINRLSPRVAQGPSAYGFDFSQGPHWKHRFDINLTLARPVVTRRLALQVRKRLGRAHAAVAPAEWCDALNQMPQAEWLNPGAICQLAQVNRLMTLQAFASDALLGLD